MATLGFMRMISASMFSSLKKPLCCATATVKFGMFGFDTPMRTLSSASADALRKSNATPRQES
jgi:hypothetical protein